MSLHAKRRRIQGGVGLQLAALVDLLFVITFLLICDRESLLQKRIKQYKVRERTAQEERKQALSTARAMAQDSILRSEELKKRADQLAATSDPGELARQLAESRAREEKLERELHSVFSFMLTGMRRQAPGAAPPGAPGAAPSPAPSAAPPASVAAAPSPAAPPSAASVAPLPRRN